MVILLCVFFLSLGFAAVRTSIVYAFVDVANSLWLEISSSTLCRVGFVVGYWLNLVVS